MKFDDVLSMLTWI